MRDVKEHDLVVCSSCCDSVHISTLAPTDGVYAAEVSVIDFTKFLVSCGCNTPEYPGLIFATTHYVRSTLIEVEAPDGRFMATIHRICADPIIN